ncbi:helix-turn-helix domain-containing protein [Xanthobacter sp. TB0139]|uniref:helix-turn-helix domain-containing protein n=1 Tax=Xanthobacter sp. TB0139 TaxID=3459178 RepID=UPI00403A1F5C
MSASANAADKMEFAQRLKTWRRLNNIKQAALAEMLGVSQSSISFWETGRDLPSAAYLQRITDLMADSTSNELLVERLFVERIMGGRALFDLDGARLLASSQGYRQLWPEYARLEGHFMAHRLVNEAASLADDRDLMQAIRKGEVAIIGGISRRMTDIELDPAVVHRWHMCFRRVGYRIIIDVACERTDEEAVGVTELLYLDDCS